MIRDGGENVFEEVKQQLLESPESIQHILTNFGCEKIRVRNDEIRCAREQGSNPTAVVIKLRNNDNLFVTDYECAISLDLINYLIRVKNIQFKTVIEAIKQELGLESICNIKKQSLPFGGIYSRIAKPDSDVNIVTYSESILDQYMYIPNQLWLNDGISLETQQKWGVRFDVESQRILLPIRTPTGDLMAVKGRTVQEVTDYNPKYLYLIKGAMSQTLFGYYENYNSMYEGDILVFESEKSVLKLDSWNYHNAIALGNNSLSTTQAKLIMSLNPQNVTFLLDKDLPIENTKRDVEVLKSFCKMRETKIRYWDWRDNISLPEKSAPCDGSKEEFEYILREEIKPIESLNTEDEI